MDTYTQQANKAVAALWLGGSFGVFVTAIFRLPTEAPFLIPGFLTMAYILFIMGRQRTAKWRMEPYRFNKQIQIAGAGTAILCAFSIPLSVAIS